MRESLVEVAGQAEKGEVPPNDRADFEADRWQRLGIFDWYATFSFDQRTHLRYRLNKPERLLEFMREKLREFGYAGPFVIVAHDNSNTRYYHAHCLLADDKPGICAQLSESFRQFGNVSKTDDGPIRSSGAFYYCANRGFPRHRDDDLVIECLRWIRLPRPRGRKKGSDSARSDRIRNQVKR